MSAMVSEALGVFPFAKYISTILSRLIFIIVVPGRIYFMPKYSNRERSAEHHITECEIVRFSASIILLISDTILYVVLLALYITIVLWGLFYFTHRKTVWSHNQLS